MYTKRNLVFNLIQNIFVGLAITIAVTLLAGGFTTVGDFFISFLKAYLINFIACLIIPTPFFGTQLCKLLKIKPGSIWGLVINVFLCDIFYVTFITIIMFIWQFGFTAQAIEVWWSMYWILLIVGFVAGILAANLSMWLTGKIVKPKAQAIAADSQTEETEDGQDNEDKQ